MVSQLTSIKNTLKQLKPELIEKYHISTLGLFGSIVRNDFNASSDVDIIVDFTQPIGIEFIELADFIERKIKKSVDLVSKKGIKQK
jgi:predicted nucleotidyltransferase